jgi:hypothetical protein
MIAGHASGGRCRARQDNQRGFDRERADVALAGFQDLDCRSQAARPAMEGGTPIESGGVSSDHAITPYGTDAIAVGVTSSGADHSHTLGLVGGYPGGGSTVRVARGGAPIQQGLPAIPADWDEIGGEKEVLAPKCQLTLKPGDVFSTIPHGGGGYGDPINRNPERVRRDVFERMVSVDGARKHYGVVISEESWSVDTSATETLRAEIRQSRVNGTKKSASSQGANLPARHHAARPGIVRVEERWQCGVCNSPLGSVRQNAKEARATVISSR